MIGSQYYNINKRIADLPEGEGVRIPVNTLLGSHLHAALYVSLMGRIVVFSE